MAFSKDEEELIYRLAEKITGSSQQGASRKTVIVHNVLRRVQALRSKSLAAYLEQALSNAEEYQQLLSALTIHFTNWFRESDVFDPLYQEWMKNATVGRPLRILCAACSTGEEVYSFGIFLEAKRQMTKNFDYKIVGVDIDPLSVKTAKRAVYQKNKAKDIPITFQRLIALGSGRSEGMFTLDREIRQRTSFYQGDLRNLGSVLSERNEQPFDIILCRNVLIYFDANGIQKIVSTLSKQLVPGGLLCVGHSERISLNQTDLSSRGRSVYRKNFEKPPTVAGVKEREKVLVVDDSLVIRKMLSSMLNKLGFDVEAVESASEASKAISSSTFDLVTLDLRMPEIDGISWLKQQRNQGMTTPVVIVSDASPSEADDVLGVLASHAQDYIEKKDLQQNPTELGERLKAIVDHRKSVLSNLRSSTPVPLRTEVWRKSLPDIIVIGASTGGTEALVKMLNNMPHQSPPVLVVQHITSNFAEAFAKRLASVSGLKLGKIVQDEVLQKGHLYIALGDYHIGVKKQSAKWVLDVSHGAKEHAVRPAADFLFRSAARTKLKILGCLLTGMGKDGALGLLDIRNAQGLTLAQDEGSCVVYGMPREAVNVGAVQFVGDLTELRREIDGCILSSIHAA